MDDGDGMLTPAKLKAMMPNYALYKSPSASWGELSSALRDRLALISAERGGE